MSSILGDSLGFVLQNFHLQGYENILEKRIWDLCTITSPELQKHHCMWKSYKFISQINPIFRSTILQSIAFFFCYNFTCLSLCLTASFLGREMEGFSTVCICKLPENAVFWIVFCYWVCYTITAGLQVASKRQPERKYSSIKLIQKYLERSLLSLFVCCIWSAHWRGLALYSLPFRLCHTITAFTVLIFLFTMGIFWKEADSPVQKTPAVTFYHFPSARS